MKTKITKTANPQKNYFDPKKYRMSHRYWANQYPYLGTWTRTREPGPVLGNLDLNRSLVWDPYMGTWTRTWELVLKSWPNIGDSYGLLMKLRLPYYKLMVLRCGHPFTV